MNKRMFPMVFLFIMSFSLIPAYAEVTSLKTDSTFYKGGSKISFSGTILPTDQPEVTLIMFDPNNQFLLVASGLADSTNHTFQIAVDTGSQDNQAHFLLKGMYNATAFVTNKTAGKTTSFIFSPDGSQVTPSSPTGLSAVVRSSTEIDISWSASPSNGGIPISGYKIERNDGNGFNVIKNITATTYQDTGLAPNSEHSYRVSAINLGGASAPSNLADAITLSASPTTQNNTSNPSTPAAQEGSGQSINDILQQRLDAARKLQEQLNAKNTQYFTADLSERLGVYDIAANPESKTPESGNSGASNPGSNSTNNFGKTFDTNNILYPIIAVIGAGIIGIVIYLRKKGLPQSNESVQKKEDDQKTTTEPIVEQPKSEESNEDYALMILKNRLVKGEITVDEFKSMRDALNEP